MQPVKWEPHFGCSSPFNPLLLRSPCCIEYRISVYGRKPVEWDTLAAWVVQNRLYSDNNVWMIQVWPDVQCPFCI